MEKFWKFVPPGRRKPHLSRGETSGFQTLCGITFDRHPKTARTITQLEGDECSKCAKDSEIEWRPLESFGRVGAVRIGRYTYQLGHATKRSKAGKPRPN
jgi:hypothetical protein